jgi:hypothetical protein
MFDAVIILFNKIIIAQLGPKLNLEIKTNLKNMSTAI